MDEDAPLSPPDAEVGTPWFGRLVVIAVAVGGLWYAFGREAPLFQRRNPMPAIHESVKADSIAQYHMARRSGTAIDVCVRAGLVAEAHLQAGDESGYRSWKTTQGSDCLKAGVPQ